MPSEFLGEVGQKLDLFIVLFFVGIVAYISLRKPNKGLTVEEYFFADKTLTWPIIGITIIASNISTEHFVAQAGDGYKIGLAVASYEWTACIVMMFVALVVLPKFLRAGIRTLPEFLEYRYNKNTRIYMALVVLAMYSMGLMPTLIYLGASTLSTLFGLNIIVCIWFIGVVAGVFSILGGLRSVVKANVVFGVMILICGILILVAGLVKIGGFEHFSYSNPDKMKSLLPMSNPNLPWTNVFLGGLWILHLNYWFTNQFIVQHSLASKTLSEGQKGIMFAASIKLLIPFLIIVPGVMGNSIFGDKYINDTKDVFPALLDSLFTIQGSKGLVLAMLMGAVISTLHSQVHACSSIFTFDIYNRFLRNKPLNIEDGINKENSGELVLMGRSFALMILILGCVMASLLTNSANEDFYEVIQKLWGFIAPALVIIFVFGVLTSRSPAVAANTIILMNPIVYAVTNYYLPQWSFFDRIGITTIILVLFYLLLFAMFRLDIPKRIPERNFEIKFERNLVVFVWGIFIFSGILGLYLIFL